MGLVEAAPIPDDRGNVSFLHWLFPAKKLDEMRKVRQRMEKRLHTKLLSPIRDIYRHMADLLVTSGYLRPLELLHWEGRYLGFFLAPGEGDIIGIRKGETSGNVQHIVSITADCDRDALVVEVEKEGPACHLGTDSCFAYPVYENPERRPFSMDGLMELLEGRKAGKKEGSYTTYLFEKGLDKILKKIGEESTEVIIAAKAEDKKETIYEIADLAYHVMVLMVQAGISLEDVKKELAGRHVIDHKVKQEKMTK